MITIDENELSLTPDQKKENRLEIAIIIYEKSIYSFFIAEKLAGTH